VLLKEFSNRVIHKNVNKAVINHECLLWCHCKAFRMHFKCF